MSLRESALPSRVSAFLTDELQPSVLARSLVGGAMIYIVEIIMVISLAALIFSGSLAEQLFFVIGFMIVGNAILSIVTTLLSSNGGTIADIQSIPSAIIAVVIAGLSGATADARPERYLATAIALMIAAALFTGLVFLLIGRFKLGGLVRFLPYPVMGGFLAGSGWLLIIGGIGVMVNVPVGPTLFQPSILAHWLPGVVAGLLTMIAVVRLKSPFVLAGTFVVGVLVFYAVVFLTGTTFATLNAGGWLLGPFPAGSLWRLPLAPDTVSQVDWHLFINYFPAMMPVAVISLISLLLNANGLELIVKKDINLNQELVAAGVGNLLGGLLGSAVGYHSISLSTLSHTLSGSRRLPALLAAVLMIVTVFVGASALVYIPRMMLGALVVYLGLSLLAEWVYQAWAKFSRLDFAIVMLIFIIIAVRGFLEGIAIGLVTTTILFVVNSSRIGAVKFALSGADYPSRVNRSLRQQEIIQAQGGQLYILKLHGYLFFGTANNLLERVQATAQQPAQHSVRFAVLDFAHVLDLDSTALLSFSRLRQWAEERHITLVLTGLVGRVRDQFDRAGFADEPGILRLFPDLDHGVEWCENEIILAGTAGLEADSSLKDQLLAIVPEAAQLELLIQAMERRVLVPGETLIRQGDTADLMYFIESGQVTAQLEQPNRPPIRLEAVRGGRTVGELGFYLGTKRTASVIADEPTVVYGLARQTLVMLEENEPEVASALHRVIVHLLGERVVHLIRTVDVLQR